MYTAGRGHWYGAFVGERLVADLGIFHGEGRDSELGRYQNVGTHPDWRRQGICGTLVHAAGQIALRDHGLGTLVMEADASHHAAAIYESVGFRSTEQTRSLTWWTD
jgi:predicted GNAT family acetyltransferase